MRQERISKIEQNKNLFTAKQALESILLTRLQGNLASAEANPATYTRMVRAKLARARGERNDGHRRHHRLAAKSLRHL